MRLQDLSQMLSRSQDWIEYKRLEAIDFYVYNVGMFIIHHHY